jgi:spore coat protein U-like protein
VNGLCWLAGIVSLFVAMTVQAGPCTTSLSSPNVTIPYVPTNPTNPISTTMSTTCTKTGGNVVNYTVSSGATGNYTATLGGNKLNFSLTTTPNAACGNQWTIANPSTLFSFPNSGTQSYTFYICVPTGQNPAAGTYTGTVTLTAADPTVLATTTFLVSIITPASCTFSTTPGPVAFTYTAFQAGTASGSTTFGATCTNALPYTMALDATSGVVSGLNYSLVLRNFADTMNETGGTGTGLAQMYRIKGTMPGGQAGTCLSGSCAGSDPRTLTITY